MIQNSEKLTEIFAEIYSSVAKINLQNHSDFEQVNCFDSPGKLGCILPQWHLQVAWHCWSFALFLQTDNLWELATTKLSLRWLFVAFLNHLSRLKRQWTPFPVPSHSCSTVMPTKNWEGKGSWWLLSGVLPIWFCYYLVLPRCSNPISLPCKLYGMGSEHAQQTEMETGWLWAIF